MERELREALDQGDHEGFAQRLADDAVLVGGDGVTSTGWATSIWENRDGTWRTVFHRSSEGPSTEQTARRGEEPETRTRNLPDVPCMDRYHDERRSLHRSHRRPRSGPLPLSLSPSRRRSGGLAFPGLGILLTI